MKKLKEYNFKQGKRISLFDKFKIMRILDNISVYELIQLNKKYNNYSARIERGNFGKR